MLTDAQATAVSNAVVKRAFKRGDTIVEQGRKSNALFILLNGRARVMTMDARGREVILATLHPGDHIGEMSLIDNEAHSATVCVDIATDVLMLGRTEFARCLRDNLSMSYEVMRGLVRRLRHADRKIETLALMDVYGRIARALLEFAVENENGELVIREKFSQQDLGKMVGASREMVTRAIRGLKASGFITSQPDGTILVREHLADCN
jgi:CRP-like cAMP-binding protein